MSLKRTIIITLAFALAAPAVALAQDTDPEQEAARPTRHYDFDDDLVTAGFDRGRGEIVSITRRTKVSSLIEVRKDFVPELLKMAEDI